MKLSNKDFVHFHCHSYFSKFDGLANLNELVMEARKMGFPALALTDHGNIMGWIKFIEACTSIKNKKDEPIPYDPIKPILGAEFYLSRKMDIGQYDKKAHKQGKPKKNQPEGRKGNRHLNLYAMNWEGYQNLCTLSQKSWTDGFYSDPRIDLSLLEKYSKGIMCGSACLSSVINFNLYIGRYKEAKKACTLFKDIFGENFFLEVMYHGIIEERRIIPDIFKLSKELDIPVICTNDSHYIYKSQAKSQEVLLAMSSSRCIKDDKRLRFPYEEFYLKSAAEMGKIFGNTPQVLFNSVAMTERIDFDDIKNNLFGGMRLPKFDIPQEYKSPYEYLCSLSWEGLKKVGWDKSSNHVETLKKELGDVKVAWDNNKYDFSTYFLIVRDYMQFARSKGILTGPGRGSGYASVLLRCLGITYGLDVLAHDMIWERFLAFEEKDGKRVFARVGFPDIDCDFDDEGRPLVYEYIINKYGRENVGNIGAHGFLKFKSCVRRVGKVLDIANAYHLGKDSYITENENKVSELLSVFPKSSVIKLMDEEGKEHIVKNMKDACTYSDEFRYYMNQYPEMEEYVPMLQDTFANFAGHPAGIVVSDVPLERLAPLRTSRTGLATQYPMEDLESIGLIKFDILAISTLSVIKKTLEMIKDNYDLDIDIENLPLNDEPTYNLYRSGNLTGVFQCESYGMQNTMREIGADSFNDIMAAISLFRPGPMDQITSYCARKKGQEEVDYFHKSIEPFVKPILEKTYGIAIYQESIMQICNSLAGFSIAEGYVVIKAIGKKKKHLMDKFKKQFIEGCLKNNVPEKIAEEYWEKFIVPFAGYGFNLSHAAAYSLTSYICCYLKSNYPDEFVCSVLNVESHRAHHDKVIQFEKEFSRKMNIKFLPRNINSCNEKYTIVKKSDKKKGILKTEISPSMVCKSVSTAVAKNIAENSPYKNIRELAEKTDFSIVTSDVINGLVEAGFLRSKKGKEKISDEFSQIRKDLKKALAKGIDSVDLFG